MIRLLLLLSLIGCKVYEERMIAWPIDNRTTLEEREQIVINLINNFDRPENANCVVGNQYIVCFPNVVGRKK